MPENLSEENKNYIIDQDYVGMRLDKFLSLNMLDFSRSFLQKKINSGEIRINGDIKKDSYKLSLNDEVEISFDAPKEVPIEAKDIPLDILYEDNDVIIVNKPKGMVVHPANGHTDDTLVNALLYHCGDSLSGINGEKRPGIVHRIDRDTTGALIVCKNDKAHNFIAEQIKAHSVTRKYVGIVIGNVPDDEGVVNAPIGRSRNERKKMAVVPDGREAITHYKVLERFGDYTYMEFRLETGRTHQIRVHMAYIKHPILGDTVYGPKKCPFTLEGQTLHAETIGFVHPTTHEYMEFHAPLPEYFEKLLKTLRMRQNK